MANINAISLDYDGCLSSSPYIKACEKANINFRNFRSNDINWMSEVAEPQYECLKKDNLDLLTFLKTKVDDADKVVVFIGSARQDWRTEEYNASNGSGYAFYALQRFAEDIGAYFDPFLLADIQRMIDKNQDQLEAGAFHAKVMKWFQGTRKQPKDYQCTYNDNSDESKVTLIYAQIHKLANEYPFDEIIFDFFDDKESIHSAINGMFKEYPWLLPKNVRLNLYTYDSSKRWILFDEPIQGIGFIDDNFPETVLEMTRSVQKYACGGGTKPLNETLDPNTLCARKEKDLTADEETENFGNLDSDQIGDLINMLNGDPDIELMPFDESHPRSFKDEYDATEIAVSIFTLGLYVLFKEFSDNNNTGEFTASDVAMIGFSILLFLGTGTLAGIGAGIVVMVRQSNCSCCFFSQKDSLNEEMDVQERSKLKLD